MPGSQGDNISIAELASRIDKHWISYQDFPNTRCHTKISQTLDSIPRFPIAKKNVIIPYVVNHLCNLYGTHWCRLQCIISWPFWLWIMAVTWLYLPLTLSKLGLRNLGMWAWAVHLKAYKVFNKSRLGSLAKEETLPWMCWCNKLHSTSSLWVSLFPKAFGYNILESSPLNTPRLKTCLSSWQPPTLETLAANLSWTPGRTGLQALISPSIIRAQQLNMPHGVFAMPHNQQGHACKKSSAPCTQHLLDKH